MKLDRRPRAVAVAVVVVILLLLALASSARLEAGEPRLTADYHPPWLSVDAHDVSLRDVLSQIGAKVGFSVMDGRASSAMVNITIRDASLDEALRRLLRGENHTVLYRVDEGATVGSAPAVETIVLLGPSNQTLAAAGWLSWTPETTPLRSWDGRAMFEAASDPETPGITVGDILKTHAMVAGQAVQEPTQEAALFLSTPHMSLEAALADMTRRAQQGLAALVDGLAKATRSLQDPVAAGGN